MTCINDLLQEIFIANKYLSRNIIAMQINYCAIIILHVPIIGVHLLLDTTEVSVSDLTDLLLVEVLLFKFFLIYLLFLIGSGKANWKVEVTGGLFIAGGELDMVLGLLKGAGVTEKEIAVLLTSDTYAKRKNKIY